MVGIMRDFMGKRSVIAVGILETLKCRHLNRIGGEAVKRSVSAVSDGCARRCEKSSGVIDAGHRVQCRGCFRVVHFRQTFNLLDVENSVTLEKEEVSPDSHRVRAKPLPYIG